VASIDARLRKSTTEVLILTNLERIEEFQGKQVEILSKVNESIAGIIEINRTLVDSKTKGHNDLIKYLVFAAIMAAFGSKGLEAILFLFGK
jgi:hypothetical protein